MADELNTEGAPQPRSGEGASPKASTETPTDSGVPKGVQQRIDELTAQKGTLAEKLQAAEAALNAEREKSKSEQEKAMEKLAAEHVERFKATEFSPLAAKAEQMEKVLEAQTAAYRESIPEERRPATFESLPLVSRYEAYKTLAESIAAPSTSEPPKPINGGANPATPDNTKWVRNSDVLKWGADPALWKEHRDEVLAAQKAGRIKWNE